MNRIVFLVAALVIGLAGGCGGDTPWSPVDVTGKVTYEDGSVIPVQSMKLYFAPQAPPKDKKTFPRQGSVGVNVADGSFADVTTYKYGDGLIPGKHKVIVVAYDGGRDLSPKVPRTYSAVTTTPLEIDTANLPIEIKIRKP
jgi:hypothetical protein